MRYVNKEAICATYVQLTWCHENFLLTERSFTRLERIWRIPIRVMTNEEEKKREEKGRESWSFAAASRFRAHYFPLLIAPSPAFSDE